MCLNGTKDKRSYLTSHIYQIYIFHKTQYPVETVKLSLLSQNKLAGCRIVKNGGIALDTCILIFRRRILILQLKNDIRNETKGRIINHFRYRPNIGNIESA